MLFSPSLTPIDQMLQRITHNHSRHDNSAIIWRCILLVMLTVTASLHSGAAAQRYESAADSLAGVAADIDSEIDTVPRNHYAPRHILTRPEAPDSADIALLSHKAFWRASAEVVGMNLGLWAFDRYVLNAEYARISWSTIAENFKHGFELDDDHLSSNMFSHPYNGSFFFNAGRSNGFNFWQSELFAIGGSAMWEMCMEREYPSTNDIIATPIGGAAMGEVLYRTSDLLLDDRTTGGQRAAREIAAFLIDPMRGFTRIVTGRAWRHRTTPGRRFGIPPVSVEFGLGGRYLALYDNDEGGAVGIAAKVNIEYGDRFSHSSSTPYDYFSFLLEANFMKPQPLISRVEIIGRLLSHEIVENRKWHLSAGLYQHFDYFDSDTIKQRAPRQNMLWPCVVPYKLGTPASVGGGLCARFNPSRRLAIDGFLHANGVILGGVLTDFYRDYHRNYNWASGFSIKAGLNLVTARDRLNISITNQFYRLYTWKGYDMNYNWSTTPEGGPVDVQGDASHAIFNHLEAAVRYRLWRGLGLQLGLDFYRRHTHYESVTVKVDNHIFYEPRVESKQIGCHLMFTYML